MTRGIKHLIADEATTLYVDHDLTSDQVARRVHASPSTVRAALADAGIPRRPAGRHGRTYTRPLDMLRTQTLYAKGLTSDEVAQALGVSGACVRTRLKKMGIPLRKRGGPKLTPTQRLKTRAKDNA